MSYEAKDKRFKQGELLKAEDLNDIIERLNRLEKVFSGNLSIEGSNLNINLPQNIPEIEFILTKEEVTKDATRLFEGYIVDQDDNLDFTPVLDFETLFFRNIFNCTLEQDKYGLVIRFPRGDGEWIWIPKACN